MKRTAWILLIAMLFSALSCVSFGAGAAEKRLIGDIDGDDAVTVSDALCLLRVCAGLTAYDEADIEIYDVWSDGTVGIDDALGVLRSSVGQIGSFGREGVEFSFAPNRSAIPYGLNQDMVDRAIISNDGTARIAKVMDKAAAGEDITIATLGGSITAGQGATKEANRYANVVTSWWRANFPKANVTLQNAGIGATGSLFGVFRMERDILAYNPDLVIVEYAVNDATTDTNAGDAETYENVIRKILVNNPETAVIAIFMTDANSKDVQHVQRPICEHYSIPMISYRDAIQNEVANGNVTWAEIPPDYDGLHPNDRGHALVGGLVNSYLDGVKNVYADSSRIVPAVPESVNGERYMNTKMHLPKGDLEIDSLGSWTVEGCGFYSYNFQWVSGSGTTPMKFSVKGRNIYLLHEMNVKQNDSGRIKVGVGNRPSVTVDSYFRNGWGNYVVVSPVYSGNTSRVNSVKLVPSSVNFRLLGILVAE